MPVVSPFVGFTLPFCAIALILLTEKGVSALRVEELKESTVYCSLEVTIQKVVQLQKNVLTRFGNPCDVPFRSSGITRSPHKEKEVRKEHECYRYQRGNRGNVGNH